MSSTDSPDRTSPSGSSAKSTGQMPLSKADMPRRGTKNAPETFTGDYKELHYFLQEYDLMADKYHVPESERCENVCRYMDRRQRELVEATEQFVTRNWAELKAALEFLFDVEKSERLYSEGDLAALVKRTQKSRPMPTLHAWRKHARNFLRISGFLFNKEKISLHEQNKYFWRSLPKLTRVAIESAILHINPKVDISKPFSWEIMNDAALLVFNPNRFYDDGLFESSDSDSESEENSSRLKDLDSASESDSEVVKKKRKSVKVKPIPKKKDGKKQGQEPMDVDAPVERSTYDSVEDLIRRMGKLDIADPEYTLLYYKAVRADPNVASFLTKPGPRVAKNATQSAAGAGKSTQTTPAAPGTRSSSMTCFCCGKTGHGANNCPEAERLVESGIVKKDDKGYLVWLTGERIRRNPNENILEAINRQLAEHEMGSVGFIGSMSHVEELTESDAFPAEMEHPKPRRKQFDGVHIPPRPANPHRPMQENLENILPMFDPANDDVIMEDDQVRGEPKRDKAAREAAKDDRSNKIPPAQSELQKRVDAVALTNRLLKAPITMEVGDVLGLAPFIGRRFMDMLRIQRSTKPVATVASASAVAPLIYIPITISGVKVDAIVDSGSQVDLMSSKLFEQLRITINRSRHMTMNGVTGHQSHLLGLCENVEVKCGHVTTFSDLWVGGVLPFTLLLGRPWMKVNCVSIDERPNGTWIVFKEDEPPYRQRGEINAIPRHMKDLEAENESEDNRPHTYCEAPYESATVATVGICGTGPDNFRTGPSQLDCQRMHWIYFIFTMFSTFMSLLIHLLMLQSIPEGQWGSRESAIVGSALDAIRSIENVVINIPPIGIRPIYQYGLLTISLGVSYILLNWINKCVAHGENHPMLRKRRYDGRDDDDLERAGPRSWRGKARRFRN